MVRKHLFSKPLKIKRIVSALEQLTFDCACIHSDETEQLLGEPCDDPSCPTCVGRHIIEELTE
jgi:hypothetical protein